MPIARRSAIHLIVIVVVHTGDAIDGCTFCERSAQTADDQARTARMTSGSTTPVSFWSRPP